MTDTVHAISEADRIYAQELERQQKQAHKKDVLLDVDDLCVTLFTEDGALPAIQHLSFIMRRGETLAVVGESGCGKSMTALSIMGLLPQPPAKVTGGAIKLEGTDLTKLSEDEMRQYRGSKIGMIFQEPMTSLNPVMTAGKQIREGILVHNPGMAKEEADKRALEMIKLVGIPAPEKVFKSYPHELSGGMRQRIMIAMALACQPSLLICDEPTTALDVTIQAQILQLIDRMKTELGTAVMLITHDMGVVSEMADWVIVMYAGHLVEYTMAGTLFTDPKHPYSVGLINSIPSLDNDVDTLYAIPGNVPMLNALPDGCPFNPRCPFAKDICRKQCPKLEAIDGDEYHKVACWKYTDAWKED
ncbi:MAG: ABC transporter ATP-binding protein [Coriobacteriaceae bacterium]|jgi:oligopeptide/dipeptide ABC transporter ATP-binding protein|uniref:ABC transporter ATP-binding protein n=1 Tax=Olsenella TaxID=133925 RepID=UPI000FF53F52|nr:ABC transporter ATP-binding protein [Atopobium sp.]MCH4080545.1 ABC transporter ATP-binding protein [Atopobiaceae bacterium]MCI6263066.1 ABC transporter ATP-binding protein [Olsenella sp.]RRF94137.1 MAG: ABC transporter ATP-binding protein [Coriobacteriaceae bacterium]MCI1344824.1 ABC transporter ATP-binding protein [Atopobiaceae bacterium]